MDAQPCDETDQWFASMAALEDLAATELDALRTDGFFVIPALVPPARLEELARRYDDVFETASPDDIRFGSTTTRIRDFVNRHSHFDELYLYPQVLQACCRVIGQPFRLSTIHARTVKPRIAAQRLHVDFAGDAQGWPMVGFIWMIDDFTPENGATCFLPGSQGMDPAPATSTVASACGPAGSVIVFNGAVWHGHGANRTDSPRRSIQGAYIRRTAISRENLPSRMQPETLDRIGPLAKYLLAI
jgi:ectoine hydroxylase-related dioxygenase (phytanoyl-CoA dioxygenase family)